MTAKSSRAAHWGCIALASAALLVTLLFVRQASAMTTVECQHPVRTGVEVFKLSHIASTTACPVALALFRWEHAGSPGSGERALYGCHGLGRPFLRLHSFHGWRLTLTPDFVMSRNGASFAVSGTDFPLNCS
jgi:hypothetical protein